jgi:hypothetical protein
MTTEVSNGEVHSTSIEGGGQFSTGSVTTEHLTVLAGDVEQVTVINLEPGLVLLETLHKTVVETTIGTSSATVLDVAIGPAGPQGPQGVPGSAEAAYLSVDCLSSDAVGHCVYVSGPAVLGRVQVAKADISTFSKMPAIGVLVSKSGPTSGVVQLSGALTPGGPLTPGARLWVGATGTLVGTRPDAPAFLQIMAQALDASEAWLRPSVDLTKVI